MKRLTALLLCCLLLPLSARALTATVETEAFTIGLDDRVPYETGAKEDGVLLEAYPAYPDTQDSFTTLVVSWADEALDAAALTPDQAEALSGGMMDSFLSSYEAAGLTVNYASLDVSQTDELAACPAFRTDFHIVLDLSVLGDAYADETMRVAVRVFLVPRGEETLSFYLLSTDYETIDAYISPCLAAIAWK